MTIEVVLALGHLLEDRLVGEPFGPHRGARIDVIGFGEHHHVLEDARPPSPAQTF